MKRISVLGVLAGNITDMGLTAVLGFPLSIAAALAGNVFALPQAQQSAALVTSLHAHPLFYAASFAIGSACSILGGYVAAWIARRDALLNGALSALLCVSVGIYSLAKGNLDEPAWITVVALPLSPALGALGGHLRSPGRGRNVENA